ncbi:Uncharacterized protein FWK35_00001458 [Aphis craccivora]|uniref:Uncharacterized protein n=1 Tax=Aphis craccivora TaxID=307492 RepID=A0A6G0Z8K8_APHCR|nr:Uncharacterized protein FWK35_00001458 [Aphis craccivora]
MEASLYVYGLHFYNDTTWHLTFYTEIYSVLDFSENNLKIQYRTVYFIESKKIIYWFDRFIILFNKKSYDILLKSKNTGIDRLDIRYKTIHLLETILFYIEVVLDSERSYECIDFTMLCVFFFVSVYKRTCRNNASNSNCRGGFL